MLLVPVTLFHDLHFTLITPLFFEQIWCALQKTIVLKKNEFSRPLFWKLVWHIPKTVPLSSQLINNRDFFTFSLLTIESQCLARYHDNVWYPAIVESIEEDHKYMVRFQSYGTSETVGLDSIIPAGRSCVKMGVTNVWLHSSPKVHQRQ